ncbi:MULTISPECIES: hypothetical protein [Enterococcus]|uniref:hypothetical protein n=1 Tax=Enterococcus TaxID=1350 RepID=UPI0028908903|nr:hypothetical protein [Enterococcus dispar]MDT2706176.1 hypothetical protein [Enterococcus dispar]
MKKLVSFVVSLLAVFMLATPAFADGAITAEEQQIMDALNTPVTVGGKEFNLTAKYTTQAENYLKQNDLTTAQVNTVVSNIQAVQKLLSSIDVDTTNVTTLEDLVKVLPRDVIMQIQRHVTAAADALGLVVLSWNGGDIQLGKQNADGSTSPVFSTGSTIKNTGTSYVTSLVAVGALLVIAAGAFVVGKKARLA